MASTSNDQIAQADAAAQGIDGGLNAKTDPSRLDPPFTTRSDNAWYVSPGSVDQLPALASAMPANVSHIYNLTTRDSVAPSLVGDTLVHGEYPDVGPFTTSLWAQANGATPSRAQPVLPHAFRTRLMGSALQRPLVDTALTQANVDRWPLMMVRQELGATAARRFALGYYDGTSLRVTFGNVDGLADTGESLTLPLTAQFVEMVALQGSSNWALVALNGGTLTRYVYDFSGNLVTGATQLSQVVLAMPAPAQGATQMQTFTCFNHCQVTYVGYIAQLSPANSGTVSYGLYVRPVLTDATVRLTGPTPQQAGGPLLGFAISSPTTHQPRATNDYLTVFYDGVVSVITNPFGGGTYASASSPKLPVPANSGMTSSSGFNNALTTLTAIPTDTAQTGSSMAIAVFRHLSEQVTPAGANAAGVAFQTVGADTVQFASGGLALLSSQQFRTVGGAAICAKSFAASPPEAGFAGPTQAVQAYCVVRQGAWQWSWGYSGNPGGQSAVGAYWVYDQPMYFLIDHQARVVARWSEGSAPMGVPTDLTAGLPYQSSASVYAKFPICTGLGAPLISDTLATANDVSCLDVVLPTWSMSQLVRQAAYVFGPAAVSSATIPTYAIATPLAAHLALSGSGSTAPTVSGQGYTVVTGCFTGIHDGRMTVEAGYHNQTNNLLVRAYAQGEAAASSTPLGAQGFYYYRATWEWTDAQGKLHRSAPSRPMWCNAQLGFYGAQVTLPSPMSVRASATSSGALSMVCRLYRSAVGDTDGNSYEVAAVQVPCISQPGVPVASMFGTVVSDTTMDASQVSTTVGPIQNPLQNRPQLYTGTSSQFAGRPYAAQSPPPFLWQTSSKGRAFGLAVVQGQPRIYYSSAMASGVPYEWNALNYAPVPPDIGDARSIDAIDDKVLVFGTRSTGFMSGDGPAPASSTGIPSPNDGFGPVYPVPTSMGVLGTGAPCRTTEGVIFQGASGFQMVGRDLQVQAAGALVDLITGRQVGNLGQVYCRGQMLASLQSIVWTNPAGPALVYNYLLKKWSTWPLLPGASQAAQRSDGTVVVALQPIVGGRWVGRATLTTPGVDMGTLGYTYAPICRNLVMQPGLVMETPWINPAGESGGESALFDVAVTGSYFGPHILQVEQAYNGGGYLPQVTRFSVASAPPLYQYRVRPVGGTRVWSVRYRISLLPLVSLAINYNLAGLSDLVIFAGSKQGTTRLMAGQSG